MFKISITGTKGKTTIAHILEFIFLQLDKKTLKVITEGHFVNGEKRSTIEDSKRVWNVLPTVCPGRYLWEFFNDPIEDCVRDPNFVAIMECSIGSGDKAGLGYSRHHVGIFSNVFKDHLGSRPDVNSIKDIALMKSFVFKNIHKQCGWAIFNADDPLVCSQLSEVPASVIKDRRMIPCGMKFSNFDIEDHLKNSGVAITFVDNHIVILSGKKIDKVLNLDNIPWAFNGNYLPSVWNIMFAFAAVYVYLNGNINNTIENIFKSVRFDEFSGRLTLLKNKNGPTIIADYAHEPESLLAIAELARSTSGIKGRALGVIRMSHKRTDDIIIESGVVAGKGFDEVVIYDKLDGYLTKANLKSTHFKFPEIEGRTSSIVEKAALTVNKNVTRILREDQAIDYVAKIARPGDVVVIIVNDDAKRSIEFIKKSFNAEVV